jgi:hypothetical protein
MSLFACRLCISVENTATSNYWLRGSTLALCSQCDPMIGTWHGKFPKRSAAGMLVGSDGFLYTEPPKHIDIIGTVQ